MIKTIFAESQTGELFQVESSKPILRVSAYGLLEIADKLLVVKTHLPLWEFPGGTPEEGETLLEGLVREFSEEVGLVVIPADLIYIKESFYHTPSEKDYHSFQFYFEVKAKNVNDIKNISLNHTTDFVSKKKLTKEYMNKSAYECLNVYKSKKRFAIKFMTIPDK